MSKKTATDKMIGKTFNYLTVIERSFPDNHRNPYVLCECVCGKVKRMNAYKVRKGIRKSCGCQSKALTRKANTIHGKTGSPIYFRYKAMMNRCYRKKDIQYKDYGGKGVTVCNRWHYFENFYKDMGEPKANQHIDRKDVRKGYSPENCEWVSRSKSARNKRIQYEWIVFGETFSAVIDAAKKHKVSESTIARWCGVDKNRLHRKKENCKRKIHYVK